MTKNLKIKVGWFSMVNESNELKIKLLSPYNYYSTPRVILGIPSF